MPELLHPIPLPDPYVWKVNGEWFIYGTNGAPSDFHALRGKQVAPGSLRKESYSIEYPGHENLMIWGFHPYRHVDGTYHAVGTIHLGYFKTEIAYFAPAEPGIAGFPPTKWKFVRTLVPYVEGKVAAYESKIVQNGSDTYLMYCRAAGLGNDVSILLQRMKAVGQIDESVAPHVLLKPEGFRSEDRNPGSPLQLVEGPNLVVEGGKFILLYTVGDFMQRNYKVAFAYSDTLIPAQGKTYQRVLQGNEVHYLLQSEDPVKPNYVGDTVLAPGLANLVRENGRSYLVFHGYKPKEGALDPTQRLVWRIPVTVKVDPKLPAQQWVRLKR